MPRARLILFAFLLSFSASAQQLHVESYTPANGLLDTRVIKIFQDHRGLIYFLTWEGISKFDGQRFENIIEYNGESLGLVNDMIQWKGDTCYVFTFQKGVYKLIHNRLIKDTAFNNVVEPNQVINTGDNNWIITSNTGLFKWDGASCRPVLIQPVNKKETAIDYAAVKNGYLVYCRSGEKMLRMMQLAGNVITDSLPGMTVSNIIADNGNTIFINKDGKWAQLNNEILQKGKLKTEQLYFISKLPMGFLIKSLHVTTNRIWLEDPHKGYLLLNPQSGEKEVYPPESGMSSNASFIFTDKENNNWLVIFSKQAEKAYYTKLRRADTKSLISANGLLNDEDNNLVVQSGGQIYLLKENTSPVKSSLPGSNLFYWQQRTWAFKTPSLIQSNQGEIIDLSKVENAGNSFSHSPRISFDWEGRLLICGLSLFVVEKNLAVHAALLPDFTDNIAVDDHNKLWAFARNGNITSYSFKNNVLEKNKDSFRVNIGPRYVLYWNADTFCVGTRHLGIIWLSLKNGALKETGRLNTSKGLSNNFASCLVKKSSNLLYAGTEFGLDEISITGSDTTVQNLSAAVTVYMPFTYIVKNNRDAIFARSNDNQLWSVTEKANAGSGFVPAVWFNEITVNGNTTGESIHSFSYNQNNFRFTVTAPCFINAGSLRFNFLLENERREWRQQSSDNFYSINNLAPGNYILSVTVQYPGKIYPDKKITFHFTINAPWWKRWWFILSAILLSALIFWSVVRAYYKRKLALQKAEADKQHAVEKERNRISRDMHDDLGSGLTKIAILSEVAKKQLPEPDKAKEQLEKISLSSRELVDNLQDIIWVLNPRNDTLENLSSYIREYALKFFEPLAVKVQFSYPEQFLLKKLSEEKRRNVYLTVKETLNNIAKHAWCDNVVISIKEKNEQFEISIKDDGKGFEMEKIRLFANGLKNMENRIEQAGGRYEIRSETGKGTLTKIIMPV